MTNLKKVLLVVLVAGLAAIGYKFGIKSDENQVAGAGATPGTSAGTETTAPSPAPVAETTPPAQGKEISATQTYRDPSGEEQVTFMLTIDKDGIITDAASTVLAENPVALKRQTAFRDGFVAAVKGKKLSELTAIDRVGGSSLTTGAFNAALASLKAQI